MDIPEYCPKCGVAKLTKYGDIYGCDECEATFRFYVEETDRGLEFKMEEIS